MIKRLNEPNNVSYTVRIYTCGCYAVGPRDIPPYCPKHVIPIPCDCTPLSPVQHSLTDGAHGWLDIGEV